MYKLIFPRRLDTATFLFPSLDEAVTFPEGWKVNLDPFKSPIVKNQNSFLRAKALFDTLYTIGVALMYNKKNWLLKRLTSLDLALAKISLLGEGFWILYQG